jgi:hypothetical protein
MPRRNYYRKRETVPEEVSTKKDNNVFAALSLVSDTESESESEPKSESGSDSSTKNKVSNSNKSGYKDYKNAEVKEDNKKYSAKEDSEDSYDTKKDTDVPVHSYVPPVSSGIWETPKKKKKWLTSGSLKKPEFDSSTDITDENKVKMGDDKHLNSKWNVSLHNTSKGDDWSLESYDHVTSFNTIGGFWRFFNNFHLLDKIDNHVFIMRDGITPIWEDVNNRKGGICSFKIEFISKGSRNNMGSEIMMSICILLMNESFVKNNMIINGISYSVKNRSILVKLWVKNFKENDSFQYKLPLDFLTRIDTVLQRCDTGYRNRHNDSSKVSIRYCEIVPEH